MTAILKIRAIEEDRRETREEEGRIREEAQKELAPRWRRKGKGS